MPPEGRRRLLRRTLRFIARAAFAAVIGVCVYAAIQVFSDRYGFGVAARADATSPGSIPLGILGDSDSHSYQDRLTFPPGSPDRGGPYRRTTFQWPEVLALVRGDQLDLGPWGPWGTRGLVARVRDGLGLASRAPAKEDYLYNLSVSGAECRDLLQGPARQTERLLALMNQAPARWERGVVVIRIGTNSFVRVHHLDLLARDPDAPEVAPLISACIDDIRASVRMIRASHPRTAIVLVGIFDNVHWARYLTRWDSAAQTRNIAQALDRFDDALRATSASDPRMAFFDDRAWFSRHWGGRDASGKAAYRKVVFGRALEVSNTAGDHPRHAVLKDGHAGVVWNTLWAQALVELLDARFGLGIRPLAAEEMFPFVDPDGALGLH